MCVSSWPGAESRACARKLTVVSRGPWPPRSACWRFAEDPVSAMSSQCGPNPKAVVGLGARLPTLRWHEFDESVVLSRSGVRCTDMKNHLAARLAAFAQTVRLRRIG